MADGALGAPLGPDGHCAVSSGLGAFVPAVAGLSQLPICPNKLSGAVHVLGDSKLPGPIMLPPRSIDSRPCPAHASRISFCVAGLVQSSPADAVGGGVAFIGAN